MYIMLTERVPHHVPVSYGINKLIGLLYKSKTAENKRFWNQESCAFQNEKIYIQMN